MHPKKLLNDRSVEDRLNPGVSSFCSLESVMHKYVLVFLLGLLPLTTQATERVLLWGDTHLHTTYSSDAYTNANLTAGPDTALRYARGLPVIHPYHRARVQIDTPLDFLVVSDHAELLGVIRKIHRDGVNTAGLGPWDSLKAYFADWYVSRAIDNGEGRKAFSGILPEPIDPREAANSSATTDGISIIPNMLPTQIDTWRSITDTVEEYNEPGTFTALIGWEWSSIPGGANLHRIVVTDSDASTAQTYQPFGLDDSPYPEDLWGFLEETSQATGARFLAIPHNSNISKGFMFDETSLRGQDIDKDYAERRRRWEPVVEITQIKGDSETHPDLSPKDEFAEFESYPFYIQKGYTPYKAHPGDYVRSALKRGLELENKVGVNPYQFGLIGSTDSHTALASAEEANFWGKLATDSIPENKTRTLRPQYPSSSGWAMSASGLAAVWAETNTREAILDAMKRREVYATTGPRIGLRFFGGGDLSGIDAQSGDLYRQATEAGVAMGGELGNLEKAPQFLVLASRDPGGANLDRIQIVKGWHNGEQVEEKVFDVAWSDERRMVNGSLESVGSSVDIATGAYTNEIGAPHLHATWSDPEFDSAQAAFYYIRVLQIPTPRHSLLDALALGLDHAEGQPDTIQERAYSSPIWYQPN